jgi:iron complex transport system ATP-binding protein
VSGIRCRRVVAGYNGTTVLEGVDVDVAAGEWVALIGPNGSGKTTLLRVVAGMHPAAGETHLGGTDVRSFGKRDRARAVAVVPQSPVVPGGMSVLDYVLLGRNPHISYWGTESRHDVAIVMDLLLQLDLGGFDRRLMSTLSGGERQRAVLARALAQEAGVLLLDEPTAALDLGHRQQVLEHVDGLRRKAGIAVLSAVHDLTLAAQYADRLLLLDRGRVVVDGSPTEVLTVDRLTRHYGASVSIVHDGDGNPVVAPRRSKSPGRPARQ